MVQGVQKVQWVLRCPVRMHRRTTHLRTTHLRTTHLRTTYKHPLHLLHPMHLQPPMATAMGRPMMPPGRWRPR